MLSFEKASIIVQLCKLQTFTSFKLNVKTNLLTKLKCKLNMLSPICFLLSYILKEQRKFPFKRSRHWKRRLHIMFVFVQFVKQELDLVWKFVNYKTQLEFIRRRNTVKPNMPRGQKQTVKYLSLNKKCKERNVITGITRIQTMDHVKPMHSSIAVKSKSSMSPWVISTK